MPEENPDIESKVVEPRIPEETSKWYLCRHCGFRTTDFPEFGRHMRKEKAKIEAENDAESNDDTDPEEILKAEALEVEHLRLAKKRKELSSFIGGGTDALLIEMMRENRELQRELREQEKERFEQRLYALEHRQPNLSPEQLSEVKLLDTKIDVIKKTVERLDMGMQKATSAIQPALQKRLQRMMMEDNIAMGEGPPVLHRYSPAELKVFNERLKGSGPAGNVKPPKPPATFDDLLDESPPVRMVTRIVKKKKAAK